MITELRLRDFRCFDELCIHPTPGRNFLIGPNAQGKTSVLEAACILLRLQSPRTSSLSEAVRFGTAGFGLAGTCSGRPLAVKFTQSLKSFAVDNQPQSPSADYLAVGRVAWISNDDLLLVRGSGAQRRKFLDFLGAQVIPGYLRELRTYERALRARNALLRDNRPLREITAFNPPLASAGGTLVTARRELCDALAPLVEAGYHHLANAVESLVVHYKPNVETDLADALAESTADDTRLRQTQRGPHRDDLGMELAGRDAATFASEGQLRSAALALKLAQAAHLTSQSGHPPVYLIDDVFGELDPDRRNRLLAAIPTNAQSLITTTSLAWATSDAKKVFEVRNGNVTENPAGA